MALDKKCLIAYDYDIPTSKFTMIKLDLEEDGADFEELEIEFEFEMPLCISED